MSQQAKTLTKLANDSIQARFCGHIYKSSSKTIMRKYQEDLFANIANVFQLFIIKVFQNKCCDSGDYS